MFGHSGQPVICGFGGRVIRSGTAALIVAAAMAALSAGVKADDRPFVFVYDASTMPQGAFEFENWVTWNSHAKDDTDFSRFDFRHEIEYGVTEKLQVSFYFDWRFQHSEDSSQWSDVAFEAIYQVTDPTKDFIGSALYGEIKVGNDLVELEGKLILQKNIGQFIFAWNGAVEAEWEGQNHETKNGTFEQTAGISYQIIPQLSGGVEAVHEIEWANWREQGDNVVWVGPNISYRTTGWWITVAPLFQVTSVSGEPDFQTRMIIGINF